MNGWFILNYFKVLHKMFVSLLPGSAKANPSWKGFVIFGNLDSIHHTAYTQNCSFDQFYNLFRTCSQLVHDLFMIGSWLVHHFPITNSWLSILDLFLICSWLFPSSWWLVHYLCMTFSWLVYDLSMTYSRLFHDLFILFSRHVHVTFTTCS